MPSSQMIFDFLLKIPKNRVISYKTIATEFHSHPRTIARILASNTQQDMYPCYKVVCSDGSLGGYNLGIKEKIRRLQKDHITIINNKIANNCMRNSIDNKL